MKNKKELSISLKNSIIEYIEENYKNRSKFIQYCIIKELLKINEFKNKLKEWE